MDEFLKIVYANQIADTKKGDEFTKFYAPFMNKLKELLNENVYNELDELFTLCSANNNSFYAVEGMKLAIGIMDGSYTPI